MHTCTEYRHCIYIYAYTHCTYTHTHTHTLPHIINSFSQVCLAHFWPPGDLYVMFSCKYICYLMSLTPLTVITLYCLLLGCTHQFKWPREVRLTQEGKRHRNRNSSHSRSTRCRTDMRVETEGTWMKGRVALWIRLGRRTRLWSSWQCWSTWLASIRFTLRPGGNGLWGRISGSGAAVMHP